MKCGRLLNTNERNLINTIKKDLLRHGYLLIAALWLYTFSFIFENYIAFTSRPSKVVALIEADIREKESDFFSIATPNNLLQLATDSAYPLKETLVDKAYGIFLFDLDSVSPNLLYWNSFATQPSATEVIDTSSGVLVHKPNGYYYMVKRDFKADQKQLLAVALIPIKWNYAITTKYLKNDFAANATIDEYYDLSLESGYPVLNGDGRKLFYLEQKTNPFSGKPSIITIVFRLVAAIALLLFLHSLTIELLIRKGFKQSFLFLLANIIIIRLLSYRFSFFFDFKGYALFDPAIYASGFLFPSLGDLVINVLLTYWIVVFMRFALSKSLPQVSRISSLPSKIFPFAMLLVWLLFTFQAAEIILSLVADSKISFDVTNFFSLNIYTFISFVVIALLLITFYHFSAIVLSIINKAFKNTLQKLLFVAITGFAILTFSLDQEYTLIRICIVLWLLLYIILNNLEGNKLFKTIANSALFLFWIIFFAASATALLLFENRMKEREIRVKFAKTLTLQSDAVGEHFMRLATHGLDNNFFEKNKHRIESEADNKQLKDSIINESFSGFLNKFNSRIYTFDKYYKPLFNDEKISYAELLRIVNRGQKTASVPQVFNFKTETDKNGFLFTKTMRANDSVYGHIFIVAQPRAYGSDGLYPELFKEADYDLSNDYSYYAFAVYKDGQLTSSSSSYSFPQSIPKHELPAFDVERWRLKDGYDELIYRAPNDKTVIIVKSYSLFVEILTLFAYIFLSLLLISLLVHIGSILLQTRFRWKELKPLLRFNIRTQVQTTIVGITCFSFIVIGILTISFFINRFKNNNEVNLSKTVEVLRNEIEHQLRVNPALLSTDGATLTKPLQDFIIEAAQIHAADVNVYDLSGRLVASTQPYIFNRHLLNNRIEPTAWFQLNYGRRVQWIQEESFSNFEYVSKYVPVRNYEGNWLFYLNVPFLNSQTELNQEISNFLLTLINLNAFIFLLATAIAIMLTNRITKSLSIIVSKMREVSLSKDNQTIEWHHNDEIGALVAEYNRMVIELENSAKDLAKTEREGAWREMARQVAHEIKNPLTPMKLSIQYLQRAIEAGADNVKELSEKVAATVIQQIDQLAKIASDFSQFANINKINRETFDITDVIEQIILLHHTGEEVIIKHNRESGNYIVSADRMQMNRLFTNLIKNAIEATEKNELKEIQVNQSFQSGNIIVSVSDNGKGIPDEMQHKIFTPNFTTKSSGTGLGLAICKGIVENAKGRIWFVTSTTEGTTFFISIPAASV